MRSPIEQYDIFILAAKTVANGTELLPHVAQFLRQHFKGEPGKQLVLMGETERTIWEIAVNTSRVCRFPDIYYDLNEYCLGRVLIDFAVPADWVVLVSNSEADQQAAASLGITTMKGEEFFKED